jgi:hypothetical protein
MAGIGNGGLLVTVALGACLAVPPPAYADNNHNGNGAHNHNAFSIRSPTHNGGVQAISNANAGGRTSSRNALCNRTRLCRIHQGYVP